MKKLNKKQIEQVRIINIHNSPSPDFFHGNRKKVGELTIDVYREIYEKMLKRYNSKERIKINEIKTKSYTKIALECYNMSKGSFGTNYYKKMVEGNTGIYYAHPIHLHDDRNRTRIFEKNEKTLKIMQIFNSIFEK